MKKPAHPITNAGSVSLLMIFIVLCLVVFSALSLSGALSEYRYSQKIAAHNADYYRASGSAAETLKEIDEALDAAYTAHPDNYPENAEAELARFGEVAKDPDSRMPSVTYEVPIDDAQLLRVTLTLNTPAEMQNGYYRIAAWQEIPASRWEGDDSLNLMTF